MILVFVLMLLCGAVSLVWPPTIGLILALGFIAIGHSIFMGFSQVVRGLQSLDHRLSRLEGKHLQDRAA